MYLYIANIQAFSKFKIAQQFVFFSNSINMFQICLWLCPQEILSSSCESIHQIVQPFFRWNYPTHHKVLLQNSYKIHLPGKLVPLLFPHLDRSRPKPSSILSKIKFLLIKKFRSTSLPLWIYVRILLRGCCCCCTLNYTPRGTIDSSNFPVLSWRGARRHEK